MLLRIGHLSTLYHTSLVMMAMEELSAGFPARIQWELFGTGPAIVEAFGRGEIDLAYIGLPPALVGIDKGLKIICIAGGHIEGTVIASSKKAAAYPDVYDLGTLLSQFRTIGVPGNGSIHDLIIRDAVQRHHVNIEINNFPWSDMVLERFVKGNIDAVVGTPALAQSVIRFGDGKIVYPSHLLWPDNPSYGILVREDLLLRQRNVVKDFVVLHKTASGFLRDRRRQVSVKIAGYVGVVDEMFVYDTLNISPRYCISLTEEYIDCTMRLAARMKELGYVEGPFRRDSVFDCSIIHEVHPEHDHYRQ